MTRLTLPLLGALATTATAPCVAKDLSETLSVNGLVAAAEQCQSVWGAPDAENLCRGAIIFQPTLSYHPTKQDELFVKLGFAGGNGLNEVPPWVVAPWAADMEEDVKDINGSGRSYLLTAWYKHTFVFGDQMSLGVSGGIVDATDYLNDNAYASSQYSQFMNEALVNSALWGVPSYAPGGALELSLGNWSVNGVGMTIAKNDDGNRYSFWGAQVAYHAVTGLGEGNYRALLSGTSSDFLDPLGDTLHSQGGLVLSIDQAVSKSLGVFLRLGWQSEDAAVTYKGLYTGGVSIGGSAWGRERDTIGVGYGYLDGGNQDVARTNLVEAYYRYGVNEHVALTADIQHMANQYLASDDSPPSSPAGWIFGLRATLEF